MINITQNVLFYFIHWQRDGYLPDRLMAKEICIAGTAHKSQMYVICCHDIHINPPFLYHIKVYFFLCHDISNLTLVQCTQVHAGREKTGGNKYYKTQRHLSTLSKPVGANRNWSSCSDNTQEIHPLINPFLRKSCCGSSPGVSFPFVKMSQQFISNPKMVAMG